MKSETSFLQKLKAFSFSVADNGEKVINTVIAEEMLKTLAAKTDELTAKIKTKDEQIADLKDALQAAKTEEVKFYQEEKRVLDAHAICQKCEHLANSNCKFHTICKSVAVDYYKPKG
jgi:hypothetical protein